MGAGWRGEHVPGGSPVVSRCCPLYSLDIRGEFCSWVACLLSDPANDTQVRQIAAEVSIAPLSLDVCCSASAAFMLQVGQTLAFIGTRSCSHFKGLVLVGYSMLFNGWAPLKKSGLSK
eukprot:4341417-Amphidinium_carterae.3